MTTLTRYILRAHAGPCAFAFSAVTGLLFLTAIAQRFQELAGKGVGTGFILELMFLSLPHVVTLAVPMALFVAPLYVFGQLSQNNELVAIAAGGVHPARLIAPLILVGIALSVVMLGFNDQILSAANARFQDRIEDVARKSPTLQLRAGAMNAIRTGDGSLRYVSARSLDTRNNRLRGVTVSDLTRPNRPRFVTAESASVIVGSNGRDLVLQLTAGRLAGPLLDRPGALVTVEFQNYAVNLRGLASGVERRAGAAKGAGERAERELSLGALRARIREARASQFTVVRSLGELHRRYATAVACVVLVLLAVPLGIRFAHGGIGAVIALAVGVLFFFRVGIIWGDRLARAGRVDPILGSWATVGLLFVIALFLLRGVGEKIHSARSVS